MKQTISRSQGTLRKCSQRGLLICIAIYVLVCIGCASFQRKLIYFPPILTSKQVDAEARTAGLERWSNSSGQSIGVKRLSLQKPAEGQLLITYGNGNHATGCAPYVDVVQSVAAFDVFILEYPGYADRPGSASEKNFYRAADEALRELDPSKPIYLLGESLGTGVAAYLAGKYPDKIAGVVLLAPYNRLADVAQYHMKILPVKLLLMDRFSSEKFLKTYHGRVGVLVAGKDTVVPEKFGLRLYNSYTGPKRLWQFPDDNHWTVMNQPPEFWNEIVGFWRDPSH